MKNIKLDLQILKDKYQLSYPMAIVSNRGFHSLLFYRMANALYKKRIPILPLILTRLIQILYAIDLDYKSEIKGGVIIVHGVGTVIGHGAIINKGTVIYHQVTIGIKGTPNNDGFATIESDCVLGAGSKILGKITIGQNSIIGANVVVTKPIPANSIVTLDSKLRVTERP